MAVDLERHFVPDWFSSWIFDNYEFTKPTKNCVMKRLCKRCGMDVWHVTKHAVNVHGDDIPVVPSHPAHAASGWSSNDAGQLILAWLPPRDESAA